MPQLNGGGGDDLGANDEMIAFKHEGDHEEKIREESAFTSDLADLKSSLVNESEINSSPAVRAHHTHQCHPSVPIPDQSHVCVQVIRRGHAEDHRPYTEKRTHLDEGKKSLDLQ